VTAGNGTQIGPDMPILLTQIDTFVIENSWTRVKIPLSYFGISSNNLLGAFSFVLDGTVSGLVILFDKIRLVPNYLDLQNKAPYGNVSYYSERC
jgi:hypothetical protein